MTGFSSTVNGDEVSAIAAALDGDDVEPRDAEDDDNPPSEEEDGETFELVLEDVPPASHSVVSTPGAGPAGATVHTLTVHLGSPWREMTGGPSTTSVPPPPHRTTIVRRC